MERYPIQTATLWPGVSGDRLFRTGRIVEYSQGKRGAYLSHPIHIGLQRVLTVLQLAQTRDLAYPGVRGTGARRPGWQSRSSKCCAWRAAGNFPPWPVARQRAIIWCAVICFYRRGGAFLTVGWGTRSRALRALRFLCSALGVSGCWRAVVG